MFRKLSLALAVSAALSPVGALALGLGDIITRSALNENFTADIELISVQPGELDSIRASLATPEDFARAGLDRPFLLSRLQFQAMEMPDGRSVIRVTTRDPVREPFLDFLVEVNWPKGRLMREFTVLLDPPLTLDKAPAPVVAPVVAPEPVIARPSAEPEPVYSYDPGYGAAAAMPEAELEPAMGEYGPVQPGSTLWSIANELVVPGASTEQMAMALYYANPGAFADNDINNLQIGAVLRVPERADILALSEGQARSEFRAAAAAGPGGSKNDRLILASPRRDKKRDGRSAGTPTPGGDIEQVKSDLMMVRETSESTRQETEHLRARIRELEARLADIRQLLQLKSDQLAQLQAARVGQTEGLGEPTAMEAGARLTETLPAASAEPELPEPGGAPDEAEIAGAIMPETLPKGEGEQAVAVPETVAQPVTAEIQEPAPEPEPVAPQPVVQQPVAEPAPSEQPPKPQLSKPQPVQAAPAQSQDLIDQILSNPTYLAAGGGGAVALLLLVWLLLRRRRQAEDDFNESVLFSSEESTEEMGQPSMASEHQSAAEGEEETSFISDFSPSDIDALQEETGEVDPAAEADVYIAYGRYQQAESLINQALEKSPNRLDLKSKLLEIYFTTRNVSAFTALAASLHDAGVPDSDPATWERVASMGSELAPSHDLFQGVQPSRSASRAGGEDEVDQDDLLTDSEALANLDLDLDTELSELPDEPMGGMSELMLPDEDSASTIEPPSKAIIQDESSGFDVGAGTAGEMSEFSLDLDDLDSLESVDLGHEDQGVEPDLGEPSGLSELGSEPLDLGFSETDSGRVGYEEDLPAISLDELDDAAMPSPEGGEGEPLSELLQEDDRSEEIETKLDLARAYIEMDDTEGASEILSEVLEEGDEAQKAAAREVLGQIG